MRNCRADVWIPVSVGISMPLISSIIIHVYAGTLPSIEAVIHNLLRGCITGVPYFLVAAVASRMMRKQVASDKRIVILVLMLVPMIIVSSLAFYYGEIRPIINNKFRVTGGMALGGGFILLGSMLLNIIIIGLGWLLGSFVCNLADQLYVLRRRKFK